MGSEIKKAQEDAPFGSAHSALAFSFRFLDLSHSRPMMSKMAQPGSGRGNGLVGLDAAAQAGMIRAELRKVGRLLGSILIARTAPKTIPCSCGARCCAGHRTNTEWADAIAYLADLTKTAVPRGSHHYRLRSAVVLKYFGSQVGISEIAETCEVSRTTAHEHWSKIGKMLRDAENSAWESIEERLQSAGIVRSTEKA